MTDGPDLSPYNLLIATPIADGRPENNYITSYDFTKEVLEAHGAKIRPLRLNYCADIYVVRALLLGTFIRDPHATHMIFIDADMGWHPDSISRMLLLQRDFIAAAGPKKRYPIEMAFALVDDYGRPIPIYHEPETNVIEVSEVGACFMMISRRCAERMVTAHPELEFDYEDGRECAVFDPIIIHKGEGFPRRRLSEDYSFCYRWRQLGGKIDLLADVELTHTGSHTFKGSMLGQLAKQYADFKPEEIVYGAKTA